MRFVDLDQVFTDLRLLKAAGIRQLYIMDPTFNSDPERAKKILRHILALDTQAEINAEMVPEFLDRELLSLALAAGMRNLEVGIQSIHRPALKTMGPPRSERRLKECLDMAAKLRIGEQRLNLIPQIIYGLPWEGLAEYCESFDFVYSLDATEVAMYHLLMLRDTPFYRDRQIHGLAYEEAPPHRLTASRSWPRSDLALAGKLSCAAMATQYSLRPYIQRYCAKWALKPSQFFREKLDIGAAPDVLAVSFPVYEAAHANVLTELVEHLGDLLLADEASEEVREAVRRARRLLRVRGQLVAQEGQAGA